MPTNQYKSFATDPAAALLPIDAYVQDNQGIRTKGNVPGSMALSTLVNRAARQASVMAEALGELIVDSGLDALDNGDVLAIKNALSASFQFLSSSGMSKYLTPQLFDSPGTYEIVVPENISKMLILRASAAGAGASGAGAFDTSGNNVICDGGGGGAGESIVDEVITVVPGEILTIVIGKGGTGGAKGNLTTVGENGTAGTRTQIIGSASGVILDLAGGNPPNQPYANTAFFLGGFAGGQRGAQRGSTGTSKTKSSNILASSLAVGGQNIIGIPGVCGSYPYTSRTPDGEDGVYGAGAAGGFSYNNETGATAFGNGGDGGDGIIEFVWGVDAA